MSAPQHPSSQWAPAPHAPRAGPPHFTIHHKSTAMEEMNEKSWRGRRGERAATRSPRTLENTRFWKFTRCLGDNGLQLRTFTAVVEHFGAAHKAFSSRHYAQLSRCYVMLGPSVPPPPPRWEASPLRMSDALSEVLTRSSSFITFILCFSWTLPAGTENVKSHNHRSI